jgi:hypothetical protein
MYLHRIHQVSMKKSHFWWQGLPLDLWLLLRLPPKPVFGVIRRRCHFAFPSRIILASDVDDLLGKPDGRYARGGAVDHTGLPHAHRQACRDRQIQARRGHVTSDRLQLHVTSDRSQTTCQI